LTAPTPPSPSYPTTQSAPSTSLPHLHNHKPLLLHNHKPLLLHNRKPLLTLACRWVVAAVDAFVRLSRKTPSKTVFRRFIVGASGEATETKEYKFFFEDHNLAMQVQSLDLMNLNAKPL
jgi:hypothetical protein